jgi:guanine deaminase
MSADFMRRTIALGLENVRSGTGGPFAALIVKDGAVISEGANCVTTTNDPTAHAEVVAIREACRKLGNFQLSGCDLYTTCEPCPMCLGAIYWARPARVYYACLAADAAAAGFAGLSSHANAATSPRRVSRDFHSLDAPGKENPLLSALARNYGDVCGRVSGCGS